MKCSRHHPDSFTLVEMLAVLAIMLVLIGLAVPSMMKIVRGSNLTVGSNHLVDQFNLSRQVAMAKNCKVEVRLYQLPDSTAASPTSPTVYRAFQCFSLDNNGAQTNALTKVLFLPDRVVMSANSTASTLLTPANPPYAVAGTTAGTPLETFSPSAYNYVAFHFKPDGSTDLAPSFGSPWFLSLSNENDPVQNSTTGLPANFVTIQVDAQTGRVRYFRPN